MIWVASEKETTTSKEVGDTLTLKVQLTELDLAAAVDSVLQHNTTVYR